MPVSTLDAPAGTAERRIARRFQPALHTICRLRAETRGVGLVWDVSETGVSMLLANPPLAGTAVEGTLSAEGGDGETVTRTLHVVHVRPLPTGDFFLGAHFSPPLNAEEMRAFVGPPPRPLPKKG